MTLKPTGDFLEVRFERGFSFVPLADLGGWPGAAEMPEGDLIDVSDCPASQPLRAILAASSTDGRALRARLHRDASALDLAKAGWDAMRSEDEAARPRQRKGAMRGYQPPKGLISTVPVALRSKSPLRRMGEP